VSWKNSGNFVAMAEGKEKKRETISGAKLHYLTCRTCISTWKKTDDHIHDICNEKIN